MPKTIKLVDATITRIMLRPQGDEVYMEVHYQQLDDVGAPHASGTYEQQLTGAQKTTIKNFISGHIIPAIKVKEGL